ncbi:MAG: oxidoreductase [Odoribacter sp.]|nr:oxidoreductase [Odoribacter sp.]
MTRFSRRGFLKTGITGAAGIIAFSPAMASNEDSKQEKNIIYRTLGKTGLKVPVVSFGVMRADNPNLCKAAYEKGITLFDTANGYQNGNNEIMLGNLLKDYPRNSFILETKVKPVGVDRDGVPSAQTTAEDFLTKFQTSLDRLKMDYVDILYVHDVRNPVLLEFKPILDAIKNLKKQGKTKFIGFSTHTNMASVINAAAATNTWDVILTSYNYKLDNITELDAALKNANDSGIGIVAMKTIPGGGFLDKEKTKPLNTAAAIKWALSNPNVHTTIPGMTTFDHLDMNVKIMEDITMSEQEKNDLLIAGTEPGLFCTGCSKCIPACPLNLPVPDLMRAYMYAYGYSNPAMAYDLLGDLGTGSSPCTNCENCNVKCSNNFNVREKIADISRLVNVPADFIL